MVKGKLENIIAGIIGLAFAAFVYLYSNTFPNVVTMSIGPDFFPKLLAIGLALSTVAHLITTFTMKKPVDYGTLLPTNPGVRRILLCLLATFIFALLIKPLGFIPAGILFMLAMCLVLGMRRYVLMAIVSVMVPVVVTLVFRFGLKIFLPSGILTPILG